jgi:putative ABC transport system ATP-binding protein
MVTHDPRIAAYADRIVFLKDGKIVSETQLESKRTDNADSVMQMVKANA